MLLILDDAKVFQKSIQAISVLIDEAEFIINASGLNLRAADPSQISLVDFSLPKEAFSSFDVKAEKKIGVDIDYLGQVMGRAKANEKLEISLTEGNTMHLTFKGNNVRTFSIPLLDLNKQEAPSPKIQFEGEITIEAGILQEALKDAALVSSHIKLGVQEKAFFIRAESSKGSVDNETKTGDSAIKSFSATKNIKSMFPLDYLNDMLKAADSATEVSLSLKTDAPVKISYLIGKAKIIYFLAPRIEE